MGQTVLGQKYMAALTQSIDTFKSEEISLTTKVFGVNVTALDEEGVAVDIFHLPTNTLLESIDYNPKDILTEEKEWEMDDFNE
jgi:hypothetical protein